MAVEFSVEIALRRLLSCFSVYVCGIEGWELLWAAVRGTDTSATSEDCAWWPPG